jgi:hypothetical protein
MNHGVFYHTGAYFLISKNKNILVSIPNSQNYLLAMFAKFQTFEMCVIQNGSQVVAILDERCYLLPEAAFSLIMSGRGL